jgi:hypothetical protein
VGIEWAGPDVDPSTLVFSIYNAENIIPPSRLLLVVVKYEIGVACNHAKRLGSVRAFNGVGFIIIPIRVLQAEVDVVRIIVDLGVREVDYRAVMRRGWFVIFYKHAFGIQVGIFRSFLSDEGRFSGDKGGWGDKSEWTHWLMWFWLFVWLM